MTTINVVTFLAGVAAGFCFRMYLAARRERKRRHIHVIDLTAERERRRR